jgi:hypothetical protein
MLPCVFIVYGNILKYTKLSSLPGNIYPSEPNYRLNFTNVFNHKNGLNLGSDPLNLRLIGLTPGKPSSFLQNILIIFSTFNPFNPFVHFSLNFIKNNSLPFSVKTMKNISYFYEFSCIILNTFIAKECFFVMT